MDSRSPQTWSQEALQPLWERFVGGRGKVLLCRAEPASRPEESRLGREARARLTQELGFPYVSVTHSGGWVLAVGAEIRVGVDLENQAREVRPGVVERLTTSEELRQGWDPLCVWTLKEAAYKAHPDSEGSVLSDYRLVSPDRVQGPSHVLRVQAVPIDGWWVAFAALSAGL